MKCMFTSGNIYLPQESLYCLQGTRAAWRHKHVACRVAGHHCLPSQAGRGGTVHKLCDQRRAAIYADLKVHVFLNRMIESGLQSNCMK